MVLTEVVDALVDEGVEEVDTEDRLEDVGTTELVVVMATELLVVAATELDADWGPEEDVVAGAAVVEV